MKKIKNLRNDSTEQDVNQKLLSQLNKHKLPTWQQFKQLPKVLDKKERLQGLIAVTVLIIAILGLATTWFVRSSIVAPKAGGNYSEGLLGAPNLINPILATSDVDRDLVKLIFAGLMKYDSAGNLVPDLASGYTIDAEHKIYTFELRDDIYWHDEQPIIADDIVFTINRIKNPEYKSPLKNSFNGISVTQINEKTIQFTLAKPFAPFLSILTVGVLPQHRWYSIPDFGAELAEENKKPIGSGPYKFKALTKDSNGNIKNYTLESYSQYHFGQAYIDEITLKFYPDFETAVAALQNKNVDGLIYLPKEYKTTIKNRRVFFKDLSSAQYTALFFNPENNNLLSDLNFRKALTLSIDKQKILTESLNDDGQIIHSPILPGLLGYDSGIKDVDYDPDQAAQLLDQLDWKLPEQGNIRLKDEEELTIKLTTVDQTENVRAVSIIKDAWEALGIKTELEIVAKNKIKQEVINNRNYQILLFSEIINVSSGPYPFWHSSQNKHPGLNLSILANKDIDQYLEDARDAQKDLEKEEALKEFQNKLLEQHFAVFLYNPTYTYPISKNLKGLDELKFINLPADRFNDIHTWFIKTKRKLSK